MLKLKAAMALHSQKLEELEKPVFHIATLWIILDAYRNFPVDFVVSYGKSNTEEVNKAQFGSFNIFISRTETGLASCLNEKKVPTSNMYKNIGDILVNF